MKLKEQVEKELLDLEEAQIKENQRRAQLECEERERRERLLQKREFILRNKARFLHLFHDNCEKSFLNFFYRLLKVIKISKINEKNLNAKNFGKKFARRVIYEASLQQILGKEFLYLIQSTPAAIATNIP